MGYEHPGMGRAELPPHARRRVGSINIRNSFRGITSACAEKRTAHTLTSKKPRNYLRMRGEEWPSSLFSSQFRELPPHARRRVHSILFDVIDIGITSACAEKRTTPNRKIWILGNYLRMRGEERGRHPIRHLRGGITSACAEKRSGLARV